MKLFNKKSEQQLSSNKETDLAKTSSVNPELQKTQSLKLPNLNIKFSAVDLIFKLSILSLTIFSQIKIEALINKSSVSLHIMQLSLMLLYLFWNLYSEQRPTL